MSRAEAIEFAKYVRDRPFQQTFHPKVDNLAREFLAALAELETTRSVRDENESAAAWWARRAHSAEERAERAERENEQLAAALEDVVTSYTQWAEDHGDGEYAYWKSPDLCNACIAAREVLAAEPKEASA